MATRNPGTDFRLDWFEGVTVNTPAAERRAASLPARRSLKNEWQAAWLLNAVRCIDLTTLAGDDTPDRVARLCAKARQPVDAGDLALMGVAQLTTGAVCVYPTWSLRRNGRWRARRFPSPRSRRAFRPG